MGCSLCACYAVAISQAHSRVSLIYGCLRGSQRRTALSFLIDVWLVSNQEGLGGNLLGFSLHLQERRRAELHRAICIVLIAHLWHRAAPASLGCDWNVDARTTWRGATHPAHCVCVCVRALDVCVSRRQRQSESKTGEASHGSPGGRFHKAEG